MKTVITCRSVCTCETLYASESYINALYLGLGLVVLAGTVQYATVSHKLQHIYMLRSFNYLL